MEKRRGTETSRKIDWICRAASDKKAEEIVIMEMSYRSSFCSFFVVMSAPSSVRVKAIVDAVEESLERQGQRLHQKEGYGEGLWVLLDYGEVVVHVFYHQTRRFYNLERLWGDVPQKIFLDGKE